MTGSRQNRAAARRLCIAVACLALANARPAQDAQPIVSALRGRQYAAALELAGRALKTAPRNAQLLLTRLAIAFELFEHEQDAVNSFFPGRALERFDILAFVEQESGVSSH